MIDRGWPTLVLKRLIHQQPIHDKVSHTTLHCGCLNVLRHNRRENQWTRIIYQ